MRTLTTALCVMCWLAAPAHADRADQLFKKGKKLLAEKHYAEACAAFEESDRLDPGIGAKLNVAKCYQEWGKLATAWRWYRDAEDMATKTRDDRAKKIRELQAELDPSVPRLTVRLPPEANTTGVVIKLDGVELDAAAFGVERRVDPGPHQIDTIIDGARKTKVVPVERGGSSEVTLDVPTRARPAAAAVARVPGATPAPISDPGASRRVAGIAVAAGGGVALVIAGVTTLRARDDYDYALTNHCGGTTRTCDQAGLDTTHRARRRANIATGITLVGLGAVVAGAYLYFKAPRAPSGEHALYLVPQVGGDGTGVVLGGAF